MSAVQWDDIRPQRPADLTPSGRPRLRLIPGGLDAPERHPAQVSTSRIRLTGLGRLAVSTAVLAVLAAGILLATTHSSAAPGHPVTVRPGQTLSQIAEEDMPGAPVDQGVARLVVANRLAGTDVHAGQELLVPED